MATSHNRSPNQSPDQTPDQTPERVAPESVAFAELHALSNFSFLRSASHPEELVQRAAALGYQGIAITDECTLSGVVKAHLAAKECDIKLVIGAEFHVQAGSNNEAFLTSEAGKDEAGLLISEAGTDDLRLVLLAPHRKAYGQLSSLITRARRKCPKGEYALCLADLEDDVSECLALWLPGSQPMSELFRHGEAVKRCFPHCWIALELLQDGDDIDHTARLLTLSMRLDLPLVASNDVHMHSPGRKPLQDVLSAVRLKTTVAELGTAAYANRERYLRGYDQLTAIYPPEMLDESLAILERCTFSLDELRYEYPREVVPRPHPQCVPAPVDPCRRRRALAERGSGGRPGAAGKRARTGREPRLRIFLPHRLRHRPLRPQPGHPLPGPWFCRQLRGLLLPQHHRGRPVAHASAVRAFRVQGA